MSEPLPELLAVTIRIAPSSPALDAIVDALVHAGLGSAEVHGRLGIVNGCVAPAALEALRAVDGVVSVRQDGQYRAL